MMHESRLVVALGLSVLSLSCASAHARSTEEPEYGRMSGTAAPPLAAALNDTVGDVLARALADGAFPGAIAVVGNHAGILAE
jgi:hypothetical protein